MDLAVRRPTRWLAPVATLAAAASLLLASALPVAADDRDDAPINSHFLGTGVIGVALDPGGDQIVTTADDTVLLIDPVTGAPVREGLHGAGTLLSRPRHPAVDPQGRLVVPNYGNSMVTLYAPGASGNASPVTFISVGISQPTAVAVDAEGLIYTANYGNDSVTVHDSGGNLLRTIQGPATGLGGPTGVALGPKGTLYVANFDGPVTVYPRTADGDVAPTRVIGKADDLSGSESVALDSSGNVYVSLLPGAVVVYGPSAGAAASPRVRLIGPDTGLQTSLDVQVNPDRTVTVANDQPQTVTTYSPLVPFTVPGRVRSLAVKGKPDDARRTVAWRKPADTGGRPITSYTVVVVKKGRQVLSRTTRDTDTVLRRSTLPVGTLRVIVRPRSSVGPGPTAVRDFTVRR